MNILREDALIFSILHEKDFEIRYTALQQLFIFIINEVIKKNTLGEEFRVSRITLKTLAFILHDKSLSLEQKAKILSVPTLDFIAKNIARPLDFTTIFRCREFVEKSIAVALEFDFIVTYDALKNTADKKLKNVCLKYLSEIGNAYENVVFFQFNQSEDIDDKIFAMGLLCDMARCCKEKSSHTHSSMREEALATFYEMYKNDQKKLSFWFSVQGASIGNGTLNKVLQLEKNCCFDKFNVQHLYALYGSFAKNLYHFHRVESYDFIAEKIIAIDCYNSEVARDLLQSFEIVWQMEKTQQCLMIIAIKKILASNVSKSVFEFAKKLLENDSF